MIVTFLLFSYLCPVHVSGRQISSHCFKTSRSDGRRDIFCCFTLFFTLPYRWVVLPLTTLSSCPTLDPVAHQAWRLLGWWAPDLPLWEGCMRHKDSVCLSTLVTLGGSRDLHHDTNRGWSALTTLRLVRGTFAYSLHDFIINPYCIWCVSAMIMFFCKILHITFSCWANPRHDDQTRGIIY